ncbi:hypothetical protein EJ08DRAFT_683101 [Tothia fuscella]|uniref:Uncharacterized protein n=1 Tax=Tothia fuscella TaxID=1048955 RepID=A0A9P4TU35_9PEZI|nr:hypothetical protein EJ08DRAFT_683101 [Tothia fuscella]
MLNQRSIQFLRLELIIPIVSTPLALTSLGLAIAGSKVTELVLLKASLCASVLFNIGDGVCVIHDHGLFMGPRTVPETELSKARFQRIHPRYRWAIDTVFVGLYIYAMFRSQGYPEFCQSKVGRDPAQCRRWSLYLTALLLTMG